MSSGSWGGALKRWCATCGMNRVDKEGAIRTCTFLIENLKALWQNR